METLEQIRNTRLRTIEDSADCALGVEAARMVLRCLDGCWEDFVAHVQQPSLLLRRSPSPSPVWPAVPPVWIFPGMWRWWSRSRYADAVRLIRKDNPLPSGLRHDLRAPPARSRCRRTLLDAPINIRGLKLAAVNSCRRGTGS